MNSKIYNDLTRKNLASEAAKCMENIFPKTQNITSLQKELLEINLSITAYIEESKKRLEELRLALAHEAQSSHKVVEILSEISMSSAPPTPRKHNHRMNVTQIEDNNNKNYKFSDHQKARTFAQWYKHIIDSERQALSLYLSTDATLEWFGRTIKTKKKVAGFLKHDMQCSKHDFTTVESIEQITVRADTVQRKDDLNIASPLHSPELTGKGKRGPRRLLRSSCSSPEWAEGCKPDDESETNKKKQKTDNESVTQRKNILKREFPEDQPEINNHGDCGEKRVKRQCVTVTPPILEVGQGDCMPSTSGTDSDKSHEALNAQLPKLAVECNGYIEFARTRNNRSVDAMKWDRKCKVQISYSEDPINVGEYIIWAIHYSDESKCRRNLLAAFEEAEKDS